MKGGSVQGQLYLKFVSTAASIKAAGATTSSYPFEFIDFNAESLLPDSYRSQKTSISLPEHLQAQFLSSKRAQTMGIPYSKQIDLAFDQVTPLVAAGFDVLQTTKNITFLLAAIQILTVVFLGLILITLLALIITVSPDLEHERQVLVTPVVRWFADSVMKYGRWVQVGWWTVIIGAGLGAAGGWYVTREAVESVQFKVEHPEGETKAGDETDSQ